MLHKSIKIGVEAYIVYLVLGRVKRGIGIELLGNSTCVLVKYMPPLVNYDRNQKNIIRMLYII